MMEHHTSIMNEHAAECEDAHHGERTLKDVRAKLLSTPLVLLIWLCALAATIGQPYFTQSPTLGDDLTRHTARLALIGYILAVNQLLLLNPTDTQARRCGLARARLFWTLGWVAYLVHLAMAFHHYHGWSHADAFEHTRSVSGVGEGIYVSHFFTLVWSLDVISWWLRPSRHEHRPALLHWSLHAFMFFIVFNATVVYETGLIRWAGLAFMGELIVIGFYACWRRIRLR